MCLVVKTQLYLIRCPMSDCYVDFVEDVLNVFDKSSDERVLTVPLSDVVGLSLEFLSVEEVL